MLKKRELISQVKNQLRMVNADYKISNKFIWLIIDKHVRWLIKREGEKMRLVKNQFLFQTLKCVEVEEAPAIDDCCGIRSRCTVQRTKHKLPKLYEDGYGVVIKSVYSLDGSQEFQPISIQQYIRKLENPNSKYDKALYYYYNNGWLYFPKSKIKMVMVKGYFEEDIAKYNHCCDDYDIDPCKTKLDEQLNLPDYLLGELLEHVIKDLIVTKQVQPDEAINKNEKNI